MSTNHDAVAAFPIVGSVDKSLVRNLLTKRMPYVLADVDDVTNLVAVDPATGAAILDILFLGRVFHYDATDTTTANDGVSCLVSSEGRRYKLASSTDVMAFAVLDNTHAAPPASPAIGDAYLVAAAATGAWVGKSNFVAVLTRRGWEFLNFGVGRQIYVEAVDTYYHKNAGGTWIAGLGNNTLAAASVPITAVLGAKASFVIKVENQTTNTPPGSPTAPTAYIIGPSPTGAWAGNAGRLAICLVSGSFTIITPDRGDVVFDKALNTSFQFTGTLWQAAQGALLGHKTAFIAALHGGLISAGGNYAYDPVSSPVNRTRFADTNVLNYAARAAAVPLEFKYQANITAGALNQGFVLGLYRDNETTPVDYLEVFGGSTFLAFHVSCMFTFLTADALAHDYAVHAVFNLSSSGASSFDRSTLSVMEYAT